MTTRGLLNTEAATVQDARSSVLDYVHSFHSFEKSQRSGRVRSIRFLELSAEVVGVLPSRAIRITGTNGKGTTAVAVERSLHSAGRCTLCLTSPHLYSIRERIRLNGRAITWEELARVLDWISPCLEAMRASEWRPRPTDIWTWIAFMLHATSPATIYGVYEVGKGGRCDVINVFTEGVVGLTNIGSDHLDDFGGSREALLMEKLGLCSPRDVLCYGQLDEALQLRLAEYCNSQGIVMMPPLGTYVAVQGEGRFDAEHVATMKLVNGIMSALGIKCAPEMSLAGDLPGRMQERIVAGRRFILDGAHNVEAMRRVVSRFAATRRRNRIVVFGVQVHKDWRTLLRLIAGIPKLAIVICIETATGDPVDGESLKRCASANGLQSVAFPGMLSGLEYAFSLDWDECIVTGSFKLFRDFDLALHRLGYEEFAVAMQDIDPEQQWMRPLA